MQQRIREPLFNAVNLTVTVPVVAVSRINRSRRSIIYEPYIIAQRFVIALKTKLVVRRKPPPNPYPVQSAIVRCACVDLARQYTGIAIYIRAYLRIALSIARAHRVRQRHVQFIRTLHHWCNPVFYPEVEGIPSLRVALICSVNNQAVCTYRYTQYHQAAPRRHRLVLRRAPATAAHDNTTRYRIYTRFYLHAYIPDTTTPCIVLYVNPEKLQQARAVYPNRRRAIQWTCRNHYLLRCPVRKSRRCTVEILQHNRIQRPFNARAKIKVVCHHLYIPPAAVAYRVRSHLLQIKTVSALQQPRRAARTHRFHKIAVVIAHIIPVAVQRIVENVVALQERVYHHLLRWCRAVHAIQRHFQPACGYHFHIAHQVATIKRALGTVVQRQFLP